MNPPTIPSPSIRVALLSRGSGFVSEIFNAARRVFLEEANCKLAHFHLHRDWEDCLNWSPDALLVHVNHARYLEPLQQTALPLVNTSAVLQQMPFSTVTVNNLEVGALAARHLLDLGYRRFAFVGSLDLSYVALRLQGFLTELGLEEIPLYGDTRPAFFRMEREEADPHQEQYMNWIRSLPEGSGILVMDDYVGQGLIGSVQACGLRPGIDLGVVSGHHLNQPSQPRITGIPFSTEQWGAEAARKLLALLREQVGAEQDLLIPPLAVEVGGSTVTVGARDQRLHKALLFIQEHSDRDLSVQDVADATAVPRRTLERLFQQQRGHTVLVEVQLAHLQRARRLLLDAQLPLEQVSRLAGLSDVPRLKRLFEKYEQLSPLEYRNRHR